MTHPTDWLTSVVRILEADTGDLRELALIGGADPATVYIGTRLDGVDIRGQDLRGMALPGLDLARVRKDEATQLDDLPPAPELQLPLIFAVDRAVDPRGALPRNIDAALYRGAEAEEFIDAASGQRGPIFLIFSPATFGEAAQVADRLRALERPFVSISVEPGRRPPDADIRQRMAESMFPVVSVQRQTGMFAHVGSLSGEIGDLIRLLIAGWPDRDRYIQGGAAYFMRATGAGSVPLGDAAAQIFDRLWQMRIPVHETKVLITDASKVKNVNVGIAAISTLLDPSHVEQATRPPGVRSPDLAVFTPLSRIDQHPSDPYQAVINALAREGWKVDRDERGRDHRDFQMAGGGPVYAGRMSREADHLAIKPDAWPGIGAFSFTDLDALVVTPDAEIATVAERMVIDREFWVTSRDLLGFPPSAVSLWLLLASQMRRMGRSIDGRGRQLYLRLLLSAAFDARAVSHPEERLLSALVFDPQAFEHLRVSASGYAASPQGARCRLRIHHKDYGRASRAAAEVDLLIDAVGVRALSPEQWAAPRLGVMDSGLEDWLREGALFSLARVDP